MKFVFLLRDSVIFCNQLNNEECDISILRGDILVIEHEKMVSTNACKYILVFVYVSVFETDFDVESP